MFFEVVTGWGSPAGDVYIGGARGGTQDGAEEEGYEEEAGSKAQPPRRRLALA